LPPVICFNLFIFIKIMPMSNQDELEETKRGGQQDLEHQQQDLFRELSREQTEAEGRLEGEEGQPATAKPHGESDD
jgi:hypothetical protein